MTPWSRSLLDDAADLYTAGRHRAALASLLTVLSVYPDDEDARTLAGTVAYSGLRAQVPEPVTADDLRDTRLDSLFCSCTAAGCTASWISAGTIVRTPVQVMNPRGGSCGRCGDYFCRNHFGVGGAVCPTCGTALDPAPAAPNGRPRMQTVRLNQPLVHVLVVREGANRIGPQFMNDLLGVMSPDVFEEDPVTMQSVPIGHWPDDWSGLAMAILARDPDGYLGDGHDLRFADGRDGEGVRWGIVKVFARRPKFEDPDAPNRPEASS